MSIEGSTSSPSVITVILAAIDSDGKVVPLYPLPSDADADVFKQAVDDGVVTGKGHEINIVSTSGGHKLFVNVGKCIGLTPDDLRMAAGYACGWLRTHKKLPRQAALPLSQIDFRFDNDIQLLVEGWGLRNHSVKRSPKARESETDVNLVIVPSLPRTARNVDQQIERGELIAKLGCWTRDIGNLRGSECPPRVLVDRAFDFIWKSVGNQVTFPYGDFLEASFYEGGGDAHNQTRFGAFLSVADGAKHEPAGLYAVYDPGILGQQTLGLLGKAVTFDTGGFLRKPGAEAMNDMYLDKHGAVCSVALFIYLVQQRVPFKVVLMFNATENRDGTLPRDIITSRIGQYIDVNHTDAEGRLTLVDGIDFMVETAKPQVLFDLATLTGAAVAALGGRVAMFSTGWDQLQRELYDAIRPSGLGFFPMPLPQQQGPELLETGEADTVNTDLKKVYGAGSAAWFLAQSLALSNTAHGSKTELHHLDIAGMMDVKKSSGYKLEGADPGAFIGLAHGLTRLIDQGWLAPQPPAK